MTTDTTAVKDGGDSHTLAKLADSSNGPIKPQALKKQAPAPDNRITEAFRPRRETGDEVNRFLLCALVSESAKQIKARAERAGETLPMAMVVRGVLRSYRLAAKDKEWSLSGSEIDMPSLRILNDKILKDEMMRHTQERVTNGKVRLAHANRSGDEMKIKTEKDELERAIAARDRLPSRFKQ